MMCLLPPRGVAREEVGNICVSNFLLREGLIMHGEMSLEQLIPSCALLAPFLTSIQSGLSIHPVEVKRSAITKLLCWQWPLVSPKFFL